MSDQAPENLQVEEKLPEEKQTNIAKTAMIATFAIFIVGIAVFAAFRYSQNQAGGIVIPAGTTYLGATPTTAPVLGESTVIPSPPPRFTADATVPYKQYYGAVYPFSFSYPETLPLVTFAENPPKDTVAFAWAGIPAQMNILLNVEEINRNRVRPAESSKLEYVENWWKNFSGLKGVASVTPFTNVKGMKGYNAKYLNWTNTAPNVDIFFEIKDHPDLMIHLANGILDQTIFDRIVDSLEWFEPTPTPTS